MRVSELIDMLRDQAPDAEVELAVVEPIDEQSEDIAVTRFTIAGVYPTVDDESGEELLWLIGGEDDDDVEALLDALDELADAAEGSDDAGHDHPH